MIEKQDLLNKLYELIDLIEEHRYDSWNTAIMHVIHLVEQIEETQNHNGK